MFANLICLRLLKDRCKPERQSTLACASSDEVFELFNMMSSKEVSFLITEKKWHNASLFLLSPMNFPGLSSG